MADAAAVRTFTSAALFGLAVIALSACELAVHQLEKSERDCRHAWQAGCPVVIDVSSDRPIRISRTGIDRGRLLEQAETAPHRTCDVLPIGCQALEIGDVLAERYLSAL